MIKILTAWWLFMALALYSHLPIPHTKETKVCSMCVLFFPLSHLIFYQDFQFFDGSSNSESSCVILTASIIFRPEKKGWVFLLLFG